MNFIIPKYIEMMLVLTLILPLAASFLPLIFNKFPRLRDFFSIILTIAVLVNIINIFLYYQAHGTISFTASRLMNNLTISFNIEPLGIILAIMASVLWVVTTIYSCGYIKVISPKESIEPKKLFAFMGLAMTATFATAFAANLFTLFIFYELLTISTYPLIGSSGTEEAKKAARKYLFILLFCSTIFLLPAIIAIYNITGTVNFTNGGILTKKVNLIGTVILLFCFIFGVSKTAIMPVHRWLPTAMIAPIPVSALLHAVAVVKIGIFTIIKVVIYIFGLNNLANLAKSFPAINNWLVIASCITIIISSLIALRQNDLKKVLAYSTIGQLSYCLMAISIFTPKAIIAAIFHMVAHGFSKISLFFAAGIIYTSTNKTSISEMNGLGKFIPTTCFAFTICALSMIGIPPLAAFISKYYLMEAAWSSSYAFIMIATIIISTILNAAYFIPIIHRFFWVKAEQNASYQLPPASMTWPTIITTIITFIIFIFAEQIMKFAETIVFK